MKKLLLSCLTVAAVATSGFAKESGATYQFVSTPEELTEDAEYIIAYSNPGGIYNAQCDIMSKNACPAQRGFFAIPNGGTLTDGVISNVAGEAATFRVEKCGDNFAIYMTNAETPGYLAPLEGSKNGIQVIDTPREVTIRMGMGKGDDSGQQPSFTTYINFTGSDDTNRTCFSWVNTPINMQMTHIFWVCAQEEAMGTLGFYKKVAANPVFDWTADPEDFSSVTKLEDFTITFPKAKSIAAKAIAEGDIKVTFNGEETTSIPTVTCEGNSIKGHFAIPFEEDGEINISFAEGIFEITDEADAVVASPWVSYDVVVEEPAPAIVNVTATPAPGKFGNLDEFKEIVLNVEMTRPTDIAINQNLILSIEHYPLVDGVPAAEPTRIGYFNPTITEPGVITYATEFIVNTDEVADGIISLSLPAEYFSWTFNQQTFKSQEAYKFDYEYEKGYGSVEGIAATDNDFTVYTATGLCILRGADKAAVELLPAGLYIVNGKKIIKK